MSEKKEPDALAGMVKALAEKKEKREVVKADAREKGEVKALTDKQRIDVIWKYLGLDE